MASLLGKADPTIVQAAYAAGMANVPKDYSKSYETIADAYGDFMTSIGEDAKLLLGELGAKEDERVELTKDLDIAKDSAANVNNAIAKAEIIQERRQILKDNNNFKNTEIHSKCL